jgi:hypothetical protein
MHDWNERDLLAWAERAGFRQLRYEAEFTVEPAEPVPDFEARIRRAGNPLVPSIAEAVEQALAPEEAERFLAWLRPRMERGEGVERSAQGFLTAVK